MPLRNWTCALVLLALTGPVYFKAIRPQHHWGGDFSVHIQQARNLVEHRPIYQSTYIVTPDSALNHPAAYPPVPALLLAPVYAAYDLNYRALKLALAVFAWLSLPLWYFIGRRLGLPAAVSTTAVLVFALGSGLFPILDTVGSDGVYLFCSAASLLILLSVEQTGWAEDRPAVSAFLVSGMLLLTVATRAVGLSLVLAFGFSEGLRIWRERRLRPFAAWSASLLGIGIIIYNRYFFSSAAQYGVQFRADLQLMARNLVFYLRLGAPLWGSAPTVLRYLLAGLAVGLAAAALLRSVRRWSLVEIYFLVFFAMIVAYTGNDDFRYSLPILPLLLFFAAETLLWLGARFVPARPVAPALLVAALALIAAVFNVSKMQTGLLDDGVGKPAFLQVSDFLAQTPAGTLILSWNPRVFALYTQHPSALYPQRTADFEKQIPSADHVLLVEYEQPLDQQKLGPFLAAAGARLPVEFSNSEFRVFRIR